MCMCVFVLLSELLKASDVCSQIRKLYFFVNNNCMNTIVQIVVPLNL